jgi:hypothetical protein
MGHRMSLIIALFAVLSNVEAFSLSGNSAKLNKFNLRMSADEYTLAILGDLHFDPRFMDDHLEGREHMMKVLEDGNRPNSAVVSLGDLGESKPVFEGTSELFAGTTGCFELAREYLDGFKVPFEVIGGNHDLEGIDEFPTDLSNLEAYMRILGKPTPYFSREVAPKVLMVGLGSTVFRDSLYTSHEVCIDDAQLLWFEKTVTEHPAEQGWKIFVFSHAPPMGSGLRVLQENHVVNGCCWLNHSGGATTRKFIEIVRQNACIKAWFSGHFHLGQDYEDSITFPQGNNRGSCVFAQTSVMSRKSTRDTRRQSRVVRGNKNGFQICTINHAKGGEERLDATITYCDDTHETFVSAHPSEDYDHDKFFSAYTPKEEDGCYFDISDAGSISGEVCWWHMSCGRVLGKHNGMLLEYDPSTLAPLGLVVGKDELGDRLVKIVDSGIEMHEPGSPLYENREQAIVLYNEGVSTGVTVIHPNEDGSYWRKIVRNKVIRMKEKRREKAAQRFIKEMCALPAEDKPKILNSWGPYISTDGTAKKTSLPGM